ncbi:hypothetical protein QBC32DRAFT_327641 [Pseudoneurospora amorphoporcata]|uniref:Uncharacterized protein n=1 Tax=Pseudoneurospora amorphoporcata TaxID=241081 RepID=A0AAN6NMJ6_9PEZI|nr:hypothetical protein QBC32DRAFT_327641 [Pseudoneurospora amorphoporcata]
MSGLPRSSCLRYPFRDAASVSGRGSASVLTVSEMKSGGKIGLHGQWKNRQQALGQEVMLHIPELMAEELPKKGVIGYGIFMIGMAPESSVPHIMLACTLPGPRKQALQELRKSGIIDTYAPGFHTGHWRYPPHIDNPEFLAEFDCDADFDDESESDCEDDPGGSVKDLWTAEVTALGDVHAFPASCRVQFRRSYDPAAETLLATTGGVVYISQRPFLFTVAHVLPSPEASDNQAVVDTFADTPPNSSTGGSTGGNVEDDADSYTDDADTNSENTEPADMSDDEFEFGGFESSSTDAAGGGIST